MFQSISTKKTYQKIVEQIQDMILKGVYNNGDKLPSERELTEQLGVSRSSLREALKVLEVLGLVESRHGEGSFITNDVENTIINSVSIAYKLNGGTVEDIMELRYSLETCAVIKIVENKSKDKIQILEKIVEDMYEVKDEEKGIELDIKLHNAIIKSADNILFDIVANSISNMIKPYIRSMRELYLDIYKKRDNYDIIESRERFVLEHVQLMDAIKSGDKKIALEEMRKHILVPSEDLDLIGGLNLKD